jgi:hypothetical protein
MSEDDFDAFAQLLDDVAELRQLQPLSARAKVLFFDAVRRFPLGLVEKAIQAHLVDPEAGKYRTMVQPAHIVAQIEGAMARDGRPEADEAWAIALRAQDEASTVVWTEEIAEALTAARPVLNAGDEVGARVAFRAAYNRMVTNAREQRRPARWSASLGHDPAQREQALQDAVQRNLLPAPQVAALLPPPVADDEFPDVNAREAIAKIYGMLANAMSPSEKQRRAAEAERARLEQLKANSEEKVRAYQEPQP